MNIGDTVICLNADGIEEFGFIEGDIYIINSLVAIPKDKTYATLYVNGKFVVADAARFAVVEKQEEQPYQVDQGGD